MKLVKTVLFAALVGGCYGSVGYQAEVVAPPPPPPPTATVSVDVGASFDSEPPPPPPEYVAPQLVEVNPGVEVVYDYDRPVFFSDGLYWHMDGGVWYSSRYHTGGWVRVNAPPERIRGISRPEMYAHYHPAGYRPHPAPPPMRGPIREAGHGPVRTEPVREPIPARGEPPREREPIPARTEPGRGEREPIPARTEPPREREPIPARTEPVRPIPARTEPVRPAPIPARTAPPPRAPIPAKTGSDKKHSTR